MKFFRTLPLTLLLLLSSKIAFANNSCLDLPEIIQGQVTLINFGYSQGLDGGDGVSIDEGPLFVTQITPDDGGEDYKLTRDDLKCFVVDEYDDVANIEQEIKYAFFTNSRKPAEGTSIVLANTHDAKFHYVSGSRAAS